MKVPSHATIAAYGALFFALGGVSDASTAAVSPRIHVATNSGPLAIAPGDTGTVIVSCGSDTPTGGGYEAAAGLQITTDMALRHAWLLVAANPTTQILRVDQVRVNCIS